MTNARVLKLVAIVFIACGVIWFFYAIRGTLTPFVISAVVAYVLSPWVGRLEARGIRRSAAVSGLFLLFLVFFVGALAVTVPRVIQEVAAFSDKLPEYTESIKASSRAFTQDIEKRYPIIKEKKVFEKFSENVQQASEKIAGNLPAYLAEIASVLSLFVLVPFITFFFIVESRAAMAWLFETIPTRQTEAVLSLFCEIDESLGSYIHGQVIESMCVGLLSVAGLMIIGVDYAVIIGGMAGFANMIPYLGPFVGSVPAMIVGFIKYQSFDIVLKVAVVFAAVQFIDNNFIQPFIMSKGVNIHPLIVIFAVMAGAEVGGVLGMFLAVPIACIVKIIVLVFFRRLRLA